MSAVCLITWSRGRPKLELAWWASEGIWIRLRWHRFSLRNIISFCLGIYNVFVLRAALKKKKKVEILLWRSFYSVERKHWTKDCKAILPAKFDTRRQPKSKIERATRLVQPNYYNLFDWTIQTLEPWYDIISLVKWYHITSRVSFLFTALSHWYPPIICNKM